MRQKLLIVGNPTPGAVGYFLRRAAQARGIETTIVPTDHLRSGSRLLNQLYWHIGDRSYPRVKEFNREICERAKDFSPTAVIVTGSVPILPSSFEHLRQKHRCKLINYSTDDPWNRVNTGRWMLDSFKFYDLVATPRRHTISDFESVGAIKTAYVPFAFSEFDHRTYQGPESELERFRCQVLFYGGADHDRLQLARQMLAEGIQLKLFGGYWDRHDDLKHHHGGVLNNEDLPKAIRAAQLILGVVRAANRDSNCMRTYEVPAMGGCLLPQDTADHRQLFGGTRSAKFFKDLSDVGAAVTELLNNNYQLEEFRDHQISTILNGEHTYGHRLIQMLAAVNIQLPDASASIAS